jgi:hypothetical protein
MLQTNILKTESLEDHSLSLPCEVTGPQQPARCVWGGLRRENERELATSSDCLVPCNNHHNYLSHNPPIIK